MAMESLIKVALVDQFTPLQCPALTNVGYEPKFANDAFTFRETVTEMRQCLNREKAAAAEKKPPEPMITDERHWEALATARTPMFASESSDIQVVFPPGSESVDPVKYCAFLGVKEGPGEGAATTSTGAMAQTPQDMATIMVAPMLANIVTAGGDTNPPSNPECLCEALPQMTDSLEHLEKGYLDCFNATVAATRGVLVNMNEVDATYINTVLEAMTKWQATIALAITDMHTDDCAIWDAKHVAIDKATETFGKVCEASRLKRAAAHEAHCKAIVEGEEKDPVIELLDKVLAKKREAANLAVVAFQKQFQEALVPRVPVKHLPVLVSSAYSTVSQFPLTIW